LTSDNETHDDSEAMFFTVSNPPGTVSVTALIDGRVARIELEPQVVRMTERELGEEILLIAQLAIQNARAGQHVIAAGLMRRLGLDPVTARSFLEHELRLPCAETVLAEKAEIFATRYAQEDD
jgi:hypothetical protein